MQKCLIEFFEQFVLPQRVQLLNKNLQFRTRFITVVLEDLYQQHNASAVIRTCDSFGIQNLHIIENRNKFQINKEIAVGSECWVDIEKYSNNENNTEFALNHLKEKEYRIVATSLSQKANKLENFDLNKGKFALVFGTERTGISETVVKMADEFIYIPMCGFAESLNISVSVALIVHFLSGKLRESELTWKLSDEEMQDLKIRWLRNSLKNPDLLQKYFNDNSTNDANVFL